MKKFISTFLAVCTALTLASCGGPAASTTPTPDPVTPTPVAATPAPVVPTPAPTVETPAEVFPGKIGIITNTVSQNEEEYRSAQQMVAKYGEDKIVHVTWPNNFMAEQEQMVSIVGKLGDDPEIKAIIMNQAVPGCNAAVDKLFESRPKGDIFIVYATPQENPADVVERANLVVIPNELLMGPAMVQQAAKMGAKVFIHYSFPRHLSQVLISARRTLIIEECAKLGIEYVDATAPDPTGDIGMTGAQQFVLEDVPKMIAEHGKDTAIFTTNCGLQVPLIKSVVDGGAIYPQPCCPSPYHGFPVALGLESSSDEMMSIDEVVEKTKAALAAKNMLGRVSTWPIPASMMSTVGTTEYAIRWINGEVQKEGIDNAALQECMNDYAGVPVEISPYTDEDTGVTYDNFLMFIMDYLTYE